MEEEDEREDGEEVEAGFPVEMPFSKRDGTAGVNYPRHWGWAAKFSGGSRGRLHREGKSVDKLGKLLDMPHSTVVDAASTYQITQRFIADNSGDVFFGRIPLVIGSENYSLTKIVEKIKLTLTNARAVMPWQDASILIYGDHEGDPALIWINTNSNRRSSRTSPSDVHDLNVEITSSPRAVDALKKQIGEMFKEEKFAEIKWWTKGGHGDTTRDIYLPKSNTKILSEYYPDLGDPSKYIADYINAPESVLLIAGPPGTGKTTLLRHMIADHKLCAHVVYDEDLMRKDNVFQSFLFDEQGDIMIIEDADTVLNSREQEGNKLMSRFLNVSDGLIKLPNKKLVFTTNITDFNKVDQALLRPGRCFGVMHTRPLNLAEAQAAAKVSGLPIPIEKREYTIAELFNQGKSSSIRTMGFGARH